MVDADLQVLATLGHRVSRRGAYVAHLGTAEQPVRLRVLGPDSLAPGATGLVRLHLATALPLLPGDRYVLRESGRGETVGGGEILDVAPVLAATRAAPDRSVDRVIAERGWVGVDDLERLTGERSVPHPRPVGGGPRRPGRRPGRPSPSGSKRPVSWAWTWPGSTTENGPCSRASTV